MEECIICFEETTEFVFFPCSHKVCTVCKPALPKEVCPLCNASFATITPMTPITPIIVNPPRQEVPFSNCMKLSCCLLCSFLFVITMGNIRMN